eukprot:414743-Hanusia_phi.AAC.1
MPAARCGAAPAASGSGPGPAARHSGYAVTPGAKFATVTVAAHYQVIRSRTQSRPRGPTAPCPSRGPGNSGT